MGGYFHLEVANEAVSSPKVPEKIFEGPDHCTFSVGDPAHKP